MDQTNKKLIGFSVRVVDDSVVAIETLCALISLLYGSWPVLLRHVETILPGSELLIG